MVIPTTYRYSTFAEVANTLLPNMVAIGYNGERIILYYDPAKIEFKNGCLSIASRMCGFPKWAVLLRAGSQQRLQPRPGGRIQSKIRCDGES